MSKEHYQKYREMYIAKAKAYRLSHPEKVKAYAVVSRERHKEKRRAYAREYKRKLRASGRMTDIKRRANVRGKGFTEETFRSLMRSQGGRCFICLGTGTKGRRLSMDHCHKTGKSRRLLCSLCNTGIGMFRDQPGLLRMAALYLEDPSIWGAPLADRLS